MGKLMASVSGVRGVFGDTLTPDLALRYAARFGVLQNRGRIVVGRDSRTTGPAMLSAVTAGLMSVGCEVIHIGVVPTPTVLLAVEDLHADGGIAITASHNPAQWNAMKFVDANGMFLFPEKAAAFLNNNEDILWSDWEHIGKVTEHHGAIENHLQRVLGIPYLNIPEIRNRRLKVVCDCVNGAGGLIVPELLSRLGCTVVELNCAPTGIFAHTPEPLAENLRDLEDAVRDTGADLGVAVDPDVDRLSLVSEKGKVIGEEYSLLLAESFVLHQTRGDIVTNLSSSMASEDIAKRFGVRVIRTPVGEINVGKAMREMHSPIGGEGNGGVICPEVHYTRDAPVGIALTLAYMASSGQTISELVDQIPRYYMAKDKVTVPSEQMDAALEVIATAYADCQQDRTDGLKILGDGWWLHIRKSGTEPIIRVYSESSSPERSAELCREAIGKIPQM
jgi:phosphomannomutase